MHRFSNSVIFEGEQAPIFGYILYRTSSILGFSLYNAQFLYSGMIYSAPGSHILVPCKVFRAHTVVSEFPCSGMVNTKVRGRVI